MNEDELLKMRESLADMRRSVRLLSSAIIRMENQINKNLRIERKKKKGKQ